MKYPLPARLAGAAARDALFFVGTLAGSVYAGFEGGRRRGVTHIEIPDSGPRYADLDHA